jgi:hypothetical protein
MDAQHTEKVFRSVFGADVDPENITPKDYKAAAGKLMSANPDHTAWTFGGLKRQADGTFRDEDLAGILQRA